MPWLEANGLLPGRGAPGGRPTGRGAGALGRAALPLAHGLGDLPGLDRASRGFEGSYQRGDHRPRIDGRLVRRVYAGRN